MKRKNVRILIPVILILLLSFFAAQLFSQNSAATNTAASNLFQYRSPDRQGEGGGYFALVFKTLFILGLFGFGVYWIFKYLAAKQGLAAPNLNIIKLITSVPVGTNRFIQLIEIGNNYFLIGVSENNISLLKEITDRETVSMIQVMKNRKQEAGAPKTEFTEFFKSILSGISRKVKDIDHSRFLKKQKDRLHNLNIKP